MKPGLQALAVMDSKAPFHPSNLLADGMSLEEIAEKKDLNFHIAASPSLMVGSDGLLRQVAGSKTLYREDTMEALSIVGADYKPVQPAAVLETFNGYMDLAGFQMRAAGSLLGGKRIWAMAETGSEFILPGGDQLAGYLFLATACDGKMATTGFFTTLRASCWNMLQAMIADANGHRQFIKVPHSGEFDPEKFRAELQLGPTSFNAFADEATVLAGRKVNDQEAVAYITRVLGTWDDEKTALENITAQADARNIGKVLELFKGAGAGADLKSANGTAWGLVNSVTEFADHHRGARSADNRFNNAMLGNSFNMKSLAWGEALKLAA